MNVLLVSPRLPEDDPRYGGDHAYTDTLLRHPPAGVRYLHHEDVLAQGQARRLRWIHRAGNALRAAGALPPDTWEQHLACGLVPDLVHVQAFSAVVRTGRGTSRPPVVIGTSTGSTSDLADYLGWNTERVRAARRRKRRYLRLIGAHDSSLRPEGADRILVWSEYARRLHLEEGVVESHRLEVLPPGLPDVGPRRPRDGSAREGPTLLFVGRDFDRKNGWMVVNTFRRLSTSYPGLRLIVVGQPARGGAPTGGGITHYPGLPRQRLLDEVYPRADAIVLPSRAEGFGLVLLEAMAHGLAVIATDAFAMPEIVEEGRTGLLLDPNRLEPSLFERLEALASQPDLLPRLAAGARDAFERRFSVVEHNARLRAVYDRAVAAAGQTG